jgi:hypothetical protein
MCCKGESPCCCPEKPKLDEYTPEQSRECHGELSGHPCEEKAQEPASG